MIAHGVKTGFEVKSPARDNATAMSHKPMGRDWTTNRRAGCPACLPSGEGNVPVAGMTLVFGLGLRPEPGAAWRAWLWLLLYFVIAGLVNLIFIHTGGYLDSIYGFVCTSE